MISFFVIKLESSLAFLISAFLFVLTSCEDDPLLAPQADTESDGGSYGLLILNEGEDLDESDPNPEIF